MTRLADARSQYRAAALAALAIVLAGCSSNRFDAYISPVPASPTGKVTNAPLSPAGRANAAAVPADLVMAGRWTLAADTGACGMNFGGARNAREGSIAPEGGCPGRFFTSRKWTIEQNMLVIRDHKGKPLAQMAMSSPMRFLGQATNGTPLSLSR